MIRRYKSEDIDEIVNIWFTCSKAAHSFVEPKIWESQIENMKTKYIPNSETYVYEENDNVLGFISLVDGKIAALFVSTDNQKKGIGERLINKAKELESNLEIKVYTQNENAISFYKKLGFVIINTNVCEFTKCEEYTMRWYRV